MSPLSTPTVTDQLSAFVVGTEYDDIPAEAIELAQENILDALGVALGGVSAAEGRQLKGWLAKQGGSPDAQIIGMPLRTSAAQAALVNGILTHALDYDDGTHPMYGHPSCAILPGVLAVSERRRASGRDVLVAYSVGFEIADRLGAVLNPAHHRAGWHGTSTIGALAASAAVGRALGIDAHRQAMAFGAAASLAGGIKKNLGTMVKPLHAGHASWAGVISAEFAEMGWVSDDDVFAGPSGYFQVFRGADPIDPEAAVADLGQHWHIMDRPGGFHLKPFASCGGSHTTIQAMDRLRADPRVRLDEIAEVSIGINEMTVETLIRHDPRTGQEGKYSLEFCAAHTLVYGPPGIRDFTDEKVHDPEVRNVMNKVRISSPAEVAHDPEHAAIATLIMRDGSEVQVFEPLGKGKHGNPMSRDDRIAKFRDCADGVLPIHQQDQVIAYVENLHRESDVSELMRLLQPSRPATSVHASPARE